MAALKTYDPKAVVGSWLPPFQAVNLAEGAASGTFIEIAQTTRPWSLNVGSDGEATRVKSNDRTVTVTVTLRAGSPQNAVLAAIFLEDDASAFQVGTFTLEDLNGTTLVTVEKLFLDGPADPSFSDTEDNRTWVFLGQGAVFQGGGNNEA